MEGRTTSNDKVCPKEEKVLVFALSVLLKLEMTLVFLHIIIQFKVLNPVTSSIAAVSYKVLTFVIKGSVVLKVHHSPVTAEAMGIKAALCLDM